MKLLFTKQTHGDADVGHPNKRIQGQNMRSYILFILGIILCALQGGAQDITIIKDQCTPAENGAYTSLKDIHLIFELSGVEKTYPDVQSSEIGLVSTLTKKKPIKLYKGSEATGDPIASCYKKVLNNSAEFHSGNYFDISFDSEIILEEGVTYTLYIPVANFAAATTSQIFTDYPKDQEAIIHFKGAKAEGFAFENAQPEQFSNLKSVQKVVLSFNEEVTVTPQSVATIVENDNTISTSKALYVSEDNSNSVVVEFENEIPLYITHEYQLLIPENVIFSANNPSVGIDGAISLAYKGEDYHYLEGGRVYPRNNSELSWISEIRVPFNFETGYNLGHAQATMKLYEGSMENTPVELKCDASSLDNLVIAPYKFDLKPSTTYYVVLDAGQIFPAENNDWRKTLKDTTNPEVVLTYTTPAELEVPSKVIVVVDPMEGADNDRLDTVTLNLNDYEFENNTYPVQLAIENPVAVFNDGTNDTQLQLTFNANEKKATCAVNRPLEAGKTYTLKVPAGTFAPDAHANLATVAANDELVYTFTGKAAPVAEFVSLSYTVDGEVTVKTMVEKGKPVSVSVTAPEGRQIESVTLDGTPLTGEMDVYTIPALSEDAGLLVKLVPVVINRHNVTLTIDNAVAQTSTVEEGKTVSFMLTPVDDLWTVESVSNATLDEASGMYVTEPVKADVEVKAVMALAKPVDYDFMSGIEAPAGCPLKVSSEGDRLIIAGVEPGDNIRIYTVGGSLMANLGAVPEGSSIVSFSLARGVYIIAVNNTTLKVNH